MTTDDSYGKQKVDYHKFINCVVVIGFFILILSTITLWCALIGHSDIKLFCWGSIFGATLIIEGMLASFFNMGD
ncbi:MAG: hypothetical protein WCX79_00650 [Candidatus Paceibacterota bacterium]